MKNSVEAALKALHQADSMELGEQHMDRLFDAVRANPKQAVDLYYRQPNGVLQLVWCLQGIEDPRVLPVLKEALKNRNKYLRWAAIEGLKHFRNSELIPYFEVAAKDRSFSVKRVAKMWLAQHGNQQRVPALRPRAARSAGG